MPAQESYVIRAQRDPEHRPECRVEALTGCFIPVAFEVLSAGKTGGGFTRWPLGVPLRLP